ncbi:MAG: outer membrane beta-barrel protein [Paracoccus sp. (in: a-proteobacteria)]|uniref:outer membrane protein n=1 Tax=Paracoccus sp. TaxID=267 RepID=UPI0026DF7C1B|nr:outer membrane beta-barrel protein [Paracoccus sp. (in: a-proteobacteria)]MDO5613423.1 outer membrane beta-barrel protein [Paracoccus sp. (in: a-proteobacteria)]
MNKIIALATGSLLASAVAAVAGGYTAPVVEAAPVVVAPVVAPVTDWTGFYLGGQVGKFDPKLETSLGNTDFSSNTYGLHAGYLHDFGRFVGGAELAYDKVSSFEADGANVDTDGRMLSAKLLAGYNAGRFLPYLTVGYNDLKIDGINGAADQDGDGYFYGLGAKFKATENVLVGAEVLRREFSDFNDVDGNDLKGTSLGLNVSYQF